VILRRRSPAAPDEAVPASADDCGHLQIAVAMHLARNQKCPRRDIADEHGFGTDKRGLRQVPSKTPFLLASWEAIILSGAGRM